MYSVAHFEEKGQFWINVIGRIFEYISILQSVYPTNNSRRRSTYLPNGSLSRRFVLELYATNSFLEVEHARTEVTNQIEATHQKLQTSRIFDFCTN